MTLSIKRKVDSFFFISEKMIHSTESETSIDRERMIKEILQGKQALSQRQEGEEERVKKRQRFWMMMDNPDLSLGPSHFVVPVSSNSLSSESETNPSNKKRKYCLDHFKTEPMIQTSIELQLKDPLPFDWEQCLDLESGRMYYLNRSTLKKSWNWPKEQKLDLELNISPLSSSEGKSSSEILENSKKYISSCNNMVAVACLKCHLLVMLSRSSPSCPNCKYVYSLPTLKSPPPNVTSIKSFDTLSLLNWPSSRQNDNHE